jgi:zinc transport system substrate-binding protein
MRHFLILCTGLLATPGLAAPNVVTDIAPVQSLVAMVMGDLGEPVLLLPAGADPHDFQLRPSQARAIADAGLVVWVGDPLSPWLGRAYSGIGAKAPMLTLMDAAQTELRPFGDTAPHDHETAAHDHEAEGHDTHGPETGDHDHDGSDPHVWLDPQNAAAWLPLIAAELAKLDPGNAATYAANAVTGQAEIAATEADIAALLAPVAQKPFVTFHDAYGYFTGHFGLTTAGAVRMGDAATPGAAHLSELQEGLRSGSVVCIFPEVNHNPAQIAQLTEGTTTRPGAALDPAGVMLTPGPGLYNQMMRSIAVTLSDCLSQP